MSATKIYLVLILNDWNPNWREEFLIMDEQQAIFELQQAAISLFPEKRERHLFFQLIEPLTDVQTQWLERTKASGWFSDYYVQETA